MVSKISITCVTAKRKNFRRTHQKKLKPFFYWTNWQIRKNDHSACPFGQAAQRWKCLGIAELIWWLGFFSGFGANCRNWDRKKEKIARPFFRPHSWKFVSRSSHISFCTPQFHGFTEQNGKETRVTYVLHKTLILIQYSILLWLFYAKTLVHVVW